MSQSRRLGDIVHLQEGFDLDLDFGQVPGLAMTHPVKLAVRFLLEGGDCHGFQESLGSIFSQFLAVQLVRFITGRCGSGDF